MRNTSRPPTIYLSDREYSLTGNPSRQIFDERDVVVVYFTFAIRVSSSKRSRGNFFLSFFFFFIQIERILARARVRRLAIARKTFKMAETAEAFGTHLSKQTNVFQPWTTWRREGMPTPLSLLFIAEVIYLFYRAISENRFSATLSMFVW